MIYDMYIIKALSFSFIASKQNIRALLPTFIQENDILSLKGANEGQQVGMYTFGH